MPPLVTSSSPQNPGHRAVAGTAVPRFRLARESSAQLRKALAETEAAHFVRETRRRRGGQTGRWRPDGWRAATGERERERGYHHPGVVFLGVLTYRI